MTPEIYRRVCEARPELAVLNLAYDPTEKKWEHTDYPCWLSESHAHALILAHWENMLPEGEAVIRVKASDGNPVYQMVQIRDFSGDDVVAWSSLYSPSRLEALAEHHVPGSTKGAA